MENIDYARARYHALNRDTTMAQTQRCKDCILDRVSGRKSDMPALGWLCVIITRAIAIEMRDTKPGAWANYAIVPLVGSGTFGPDRWSRSSSEALATACATAAKSLTSV